MDKNTFLQFKKKKKKKSMVVLAQILGIISNVSTKFLYHSLSPSQSVCELWSYARLLNKQLSCLRMYTQKPVSLPRRQQDNTGLEGQKKLCICIQPACITQLRNRSLIIGD